jgi:hypothetical protein
MAAHASRYPGLDLPRPYRAAAPLVVLAAASAAFEIDPRLPWAVGALGAACFLAAAVVRGARARLDLAAVRRTADRLIVYEPYHHESLELVRWRADELTTPESRDALRRDLERLLRALDGRMLPSASPLNRPAARANERLLRQIGARLDGSAPVSARGILLLRSLLRDGGSPLYAEDAGVLLPRALRRVLGALEP